MFIIIIITITRMKNFLFIKNESVFTDARLTIVVTSDPSKLSASVCQHTTCHIRFIFHLQ